MPTDTFRIENERVLEAIVGEPMEFLRSKIEVRLDEPMQDFIARSPLLFLSTVDVIGQIDVSPKGDPPGFVHVDAAGDLLVPERPGNKLTFGFRNILQNARVGLILIVPFQRETLRIRGRATLHNDPAVLDTMKVNGKPALLYARVVVEQCFFHCGKALVRSKLWQWESWDSGVPSIAARQFAKLRLPGNESWRMTEDVLDQSYKDLY